MSCTSWRMLRQVYKIQHLNILNSLSLLNLCAIKLYGPLGKGFPQMVPVDVINLATSGKWMNRISFTGSPHFQRALVMFEKVHHDKPEVFVSYTHIYIYI